MKKVFSLSVLVIVAALLFTSCKKKGEEIVVYPNPATSYIILDATATSSKHKNGKIVVNDLAGNVIQTFIMEDSAYIHWQPDSLQRGVYQYTYTADKMKTQKGKIQFN